MTGDPTQDPRDVTDQLGLQDARDDSDPGPDWMDDPANSCVVCGRNDLVTDEHCSRHRPRDESDPGPDDEQPTLSQLLEAGGTLHVGDAEYHSLDEALYDFWRTRYDTREEWEESR
jgi:hypothetical protein